MVFGWVGAAAFGADDKAYRIVLSHPSEVGRMYSVSATASWKTEAVPLLKEFKTVSFPEHTFVLEADEKVLAVEPNTKIACKVELAVKQLTSDGDALAPAGSVIVVEYVGPRFNCTMAGQPVDDSVTSAISRTLLLHRANDPHSPDEIAGTPNPEKIGGMWNQSSAQLAHLRSTPEHAVNENDVKGTVTLASVESTDHGPRLHLAFHIEQKNAAVKIGPGWKSESATLVEDGTRILFEDPPQ